MYRRWTEEELEYLEENWGCKPMESIAKELGRTVTAIQVKAQRTNMGRFTLSGDYITVYELARAVNGRRIDGHIVKTWKKLGLPVARKKVKTMNHLTVKLDKFWEWAEKNREYMDFSKMEENCLGEEPDWVKQKRKWDIEKARLNKNWEWTKVEEEKMIRLIEKGYSINQIALELKRTAGAVYCKKKKLGLNVKNERSKNCKYTEEEKELLERLVKESCSYLVMSTILQKGEKSIRTYMKKKYGSEDLDKIRCRMKEEEEKIA